MRNRTVSTLAAVLFAFPATPLAAQAADADEKSAAVRAAVLDYVEAIYDAQPERIERSVHPDLAKFGYWKGRDDDEYSPSPMSYEELMETARTWNAAGRDLSGAPRIIDVDDIQERVATARLIAAWGIDYLHLVLTEDGWKIRNVVWQSHTPQTMARVEAAGESDGG